MVTASLLLFVLHQAPAVAPELAASAPTPAPLAPPPGRDRRGRGAIVAGMVLLPLGLAALGAMFGALGGMRRTGVDGDRLYASVDPRTCSEDERALLRGYADAARREEAAVLGLGVAAGLLVPAGAVTLARGLRLRRARVGLSFQPRFTGLALTGSF